MAWSNDKVPAPLAAGVNWWLESDPKHSEDVVMVADDGQDALILSGFNNADQVAWVNPEGSVHVIKAPWRLVRMGEEAEDDEDVKAKRTYGDLYG